MVHVRLKVLLDKLCNVIFIFTGTSNSRRRYVTMKAEFYFTGNCNDPAIQAEIKGKYMTAITNSDSFLVKKMCMTPECNIGNVKVFHLKLIHV